MKSLYINAVLVFLSLSMVCCDKDDNALYKNYQNQHHSEELKGWWRHIGEEDNKYPLYEHFTDFMVTTYDYNVYTNKYDHNMGRYWYNDDAKIHYLTIGDYKTKAEEDSYNFVLNPTKDTLKIYMENPPYVFVRSTGL